MFTIGSILDNTDTYDGYRCPLLGLIVADITTPDNDRTGIVEKVSSKILYENQTYVMVNDIPEDNSIYDDMPELEDENNV